MRHHLNPPSIDRRLRRRRVIQAAVRTVLPRNSAHLKNDAGRSMARLATGVLATGVLAIGVLAIGVLVTGVRATGGVVVTGVLAIGARKGRMADAPIIAMMVDCRGSEGRTAPTIFAVTLTDPEGQVVRGLDPDEAKGITGQTVLTWNNCVAMTRRCTN
jgi:hypothetical protein